MVISWIAETFWKILDDKLIYFVLLISHNHSNCTLNTGFYIIGTSPWKLWLAMIPIHFQDQKKKSNAKSYLNTISIVFYQECYQNVWNRDRFLHMPTLNVYREISNKTMQLFQAPPSCINGGWMQKISIWKCISYWEVWKMMNDWKLIKSYLRKSASYLIHFKQFDVTLTNSFLVEQNSIQIEQT